jgi:hypothetical protein
MDDQAPVTLTIGIAAFRAISAAVTEAEIGGAVPSVTISQLRPDLELMEGAVGVELAIGEGPDRRRQTWIVAGGGEVVAHLEDPPATEPAGDAGADGSEDADADADADDDG